MKHEVNKQTGELLPRIRTQLTYGAYAKVYEKNDMPSQTVPNMAMTVREMVDRYRRGLPVDGPANPQFNGEDLIPNLDDLDPIDRAAYVEMVADQFADLKAKIAAEAKTKAEKEFIAKVDAAVKEKLEALNKPNSEASPQQ